MLMILCVLLCLFSQLTCLSFRAHRCFGNSVGSCSQQGTGISIDFLYGHGLYSQALHAQIKSACPDPSNPSGECEELLFEMSNEVGNIK